MKIIKRNLYLEKINRAMKSVPIIVLIGARQVGKTTLMQSIDIPNNTMTLFINGQDPDIAQVFEKYSNAVNYLKTNLNPNLTGILFIDEFQYIQNISVTMKLLVDTYRDLKIICSGSSSLDILQKVEESMAGRVRTIEVFSLSFYEYLLFQDEELAKLYEQYSIDTDYSIVNKQILFYLNQYLIFGGLPRIALTKIKTEKIELLDDIYRTYLIRDVRSYIKNQDVVGFNKLIKVISSRIGNLININEISKITMLPYRKCEEYLNLLEQMYIVKLISPLSTNKRKEITKMKKLYFLDIGLRNMIYNSFNDIEIRGDNGNLYENFVFLEILKSIEKFYMVYFYRTKDGSEIDFIVDKLGEIIPIEVKFQEFNKPILIKSLVNFMNIRNLSTSYIINRNYYNIIKINDNKSIIYLPGIFSSKIFL